MNKEKPYRCQNPACSEDHAGRLIFDFWALRPVCPKCGTDAKVMPHIVIDLQVVHFDPPSKVEGRGQRILACTRKGYGGGESVTGNPTAVICRECKHTPAWRETAERWGVEEIVPVERLPEAIENGVKQVQGIALAVASR